MARKIGRLCSIALLALSSAALVASEDELVMISLNEDETFAGNGASSEASISGDGRFVVFQSSASDLIFNDLNGASDVYLWDRDTGVVELLLPSGVVHVAGVTADPAISDNGRFVAFNGLPVEGRRQTYVYERETGLTELVSAVDGDVRAGNGSACNRPDVSDDGDLVVFCSNSNDLVVDDRGLDVKPKPRQIFVRIRSLLRTVRLTDPVFPQVEVPNGSSWDPVMSADGGRVAFVSEATNLPLADGEGNQDVFIWDTEDQAMEISLDVDLSEGFASGNAQIALSSDGRVLAFTTPTSLDGGDTDILRDVYLFEGDDFEWISTDVLFSADFPTLDATGSLVAFNTSSFGWLHDRQADTTRIFTKDPDGDLLSGQRSQLAADGSALVFNSQDAFFPSLDDGIGGDHDVFFCPLPLPPPPPAR